MNGESNKPPALMEVAADVWGLRTWIVNVFFVRVAGGAGGWVLVDTGMPGAAGRIVQTAAKLFGEGVAPTAIVLTHAHFDHVGTLKKLMARWRVPVFAHPLELPHLTGTASYPPPDPSVGGGAMARLSFLFPRKPITVDNVQTVTRDGAVPPLPDWKWVHTPGHTDGHISLWRPADRTLLAGDAIVTTRQESLTAVMAQRPELRPPPAYFTTDWTKARDSVQRLAMLEPAVAATGHGVPLRGPELTSALHTLAARFDEIGLPRRGRYVERTRPPSARPGSPAPAR